MSRAESWYSDVFNTVVENLKSIGTYDPWKPYRLSELTDEKLFDVLFDAVFSTQTDWREYVKKSQNIKKLLPMDDLAAFSQVDVEEIYNDIVSEGSGVRFLKRKLTWMRDNASKVMMLQQEYGSFKDFIEQNWNEDLPDMIAGKKDPKYKLAGVKDAVSREFLKNIGFDAAKPDVHIKRLLGRWGIADEKNIASVLEQMRLFEEATGKSKGEIDWVFWQFCANGYGEICGADPKCEECLLWSRGYCTFKR